MRLLTIEEVNAKGAPIDISRLEVDIPRQLNRIGRVAGSSGDWGFRNNILVLYKYESAEKVVPTDSEAQDLLEDVIELRDVPVEQIKEEMLSLQADGETRYADEIAEILKLDVIDVIEAFSQLQEEGKLFVDDDKLQT